MPSFSQSFLQAVNRAGIKRWYERELLSSHGHLVLCVFCLLGVVGGFEAYTRAAVDVVDRVLDLLAIGASGAIGVWSIRQYAKRMATAEFIAGQATCPHCGVYGRLHAEAETFDSVSVRCLKCSHG